MLRPLCEKTLSRRGFLGALGAVSLPFFWPRVAFATSASAEDAAAGQDVLVTIFLRGGADGVNVVVPFGDPRYYDNRPTIAIAESGSGAGLPLDGFFGFHPALAPLKELYDSGHLAVVPAVGSPHATRSHFDAMDFMERGTPGQRGLLSGWIGRHLESRATGNASPFRAVGIGDLVQPSLRGRVPATALRTVEDFRVQGFDDHRAQYQAALGALYSGTTFLDVQARQTLAAVDRLAAAVPGEYTPENGATYPDSEFGSSMRQVAQLLKADLGLEVACVDAGGWDTHDEQGGAEGYQADLLADLAEGLAAFYADVGSRAARLTVVTMTEFGRRIEENASRGTDHGNAGFMMVLGGGVNGGHVYGRWPGLAPEELEDGDLAVTTDYRTVLAEILGKRLGNVATPAVFPGFTAPPFLGLCQSL